ncbi:hypothetical protein D3C81_1121330 [compost metagenome]
MTQAAALDLQAMCASALMEHLRAADGVSYSLERYLRVFAMSPEAFAVHAGVSRSVLRRASESTRVQGFIRDALRVVLAVAALDRTLFWFRNEPLSTFDYQTAEELVSRGWTGQVLQFVASWQAGGQG